MNTIKAFDLMPNDNRKSFYGKAKVYQKGENWFVLKSYDTEVCSIREGKFYRHWAGYSATTMRHVNAFIDTFGLTGGGKSWWNAQPITGFNWVSFYIGTPAA